MIKTSKVTYKVFFFERVKKKVLFFDTETYPLQIRLSSGARTLYLKSSFFTILQQNKVYTDAGNISIERVIAWEEELMQYILNKSEEHESLDSIRKEYYSLSWDVLRKLDEGFKKFLVNFFYSEHLPAYSLLITNDGDNHSSEFLLHDLEKSLQTSVFDKLLKTAVQMAPPYIPFIKYFREQMNNALPLFPVYQWQQTIQQQFNAFVDVHFPEYKPYSPSGYIDALCQQGQ